MHNKQFYKLVLNFLGDEVIEYETEENKIILNLKDVNFDINGVEWEESIKNHLKSYEYNIEFEYGDGNWVTIIRK